jgi:hypothetical protein
MKCSSVSIRGKFARLREILLVLTSDVSSAPTATIILQLAENFVHLTNSEVAAYIALRVDCNEA